jgi:hypothetical protein
MMKRIVQNIKTKKIEKSEHFLRRPYEKKKKKIKKNRLRAFARTRAKNPSLQNHFSKTTFLHFSRKVVAD